MDKVSITQEGITVSLESDGRTLDELYFKASNMLDVEVAKRIKKEETKEDK